jgi:UDP-glucose 4-epimerase
VLDATGSASEVTLVPYDVAYEEGFEDMQRRIPDTTKIRERIGWEPTRSLDQILADVIEEHRAGAYAA